MSNSVKEVNSTEAPASASAQSAVSPDEEAINRLAFEQAMSCLRAQSSQLDNIRQRAGAVGALAGLAATALGREAFNDARDRGWTIGNLGLFEILALIALGVSVLCIIQVLRPYKGWSFDFRPSLIISQFAHGPNATTLSETYEVLAGFAERNSDVNQKLLRRIQHWFWASIVSVLVQIYFWFLDVV